MNETNEVEAREAGEAREARGALDAEPSTAHSGEPGAEIDDVFAVTLHPEWIGAFASLGKSVENRTWPISGPLPRWVALHAGATPGGAPGLSTRIAALESVVRTAQRAGWRLTRGAVLVNEDGERVPLMTLDEVRSALALMVRVVACDSLRLTTWCASGAHHWRVDVVVRLPAPIPMPGKQGLWRVPPDAAAELRRVIALAERADAAWRTTAKPGKVLRLAPTADDVAGEAASNNASACHAQACALYTMNDGGAVETQDMMERVVRALSSLPSRFRDEFELQANVARALQAAGLTFERELTVGDDRFDFVVWFGTAIVVVEVKVGGPAASVSRQLLRYASRPNVVGIVLVSCKAHHLRLLSDCHIYNKPVRVVRPMAGAL